MKHMTSDAILDEMEKLFPDAHCELNHRSPFELLVAVVLSAQTTDASVNRVTPQLFEKFPTPQAMAQASVEEIGECIRSIGLYRNKARSLKALSESLVSHFDGVVPSSRKELMSLAGVGRKTANVVRSVCFDIPSFAVDTHVERVSKRLGLAKPQDDVLKVEEKLRRKIDRSRWNKGHHLFIFFGRYLCTARNPKCEQCPFHETICRRERLEKDIQK